MKLNFVGKFQVTNRLSSGKSQIRKLYYESEIVISGSFLFCMKLKGDFV